MLRRVLSEAEYSEEPHTRPSRLRDPYPPDITRSVFTLEKRLLHAASQTIRSGN